MAKKKQGTTGADTFNGSSKNDAYDGLEGQDTISGFGGNDKLWGGADNDAIMGGDGNDKIWGDQGYDIVIGGAGKDVLTGGTETDSFIFTAGGQFGPGSDIDIITDVDTSGIDIDHIQVIGLDFTDVIDDFGDIMKHAKQDGKDVRLDFKFGDVLILEDTQKSELTAELFLFDG